MRILVTNDDGIDAPGLVVAEEIAQALAGPGGEVWVCAPAYEQSGVSHAITYTGPIAVSQRGERRFACAGTPADSAIYGICTLLENSPPDLVISGVNRGHNIAEDAVYSGTIGGAIEAALLGCKAVALSQYFQPETMSDMFASTRRHGAETVRRLLDAPWERDRFFNVNFPPTGAEPAKGVKICPQGRRASGRFEPEMRVSPAGKSYFWLTHPRDNRSTAPDADAALCADGWVTVTPMRPDYTDHAAIEAMQNLF